MKNLQELNFYRDTSQRVINYYGGIGDDTCGVFLIPHPLGAKLRVIASSGEGWDHLSISLEHRCPTWNEMDYVKRMFFKEDEVAMQLHVTPKEHINCHKYCLHIWRPHNEVIPLPPSYFVA